MSMETDGRPSTEKRGTCRNCNGFQRELRNPSRMDPFFVPAAGVLVASGIIGGGQVAEDWDEPDGVPARINRWDPLNFLKSDAEAVRRERNSYDNADGNGPPWGQGVSLGFFFSTTTPHVVDEIVSLVDGNGVKVGSPGYANPEIRPGDTILYVEDMKADYAPTSMLKAALQGGRPTTVNITFQRADQPPFTATLMRHSLNNQKNGNGRIIEPDLPATVYRYGAPTSTSYHTPGYYTTPEARGQTYSVPYRKDMGLIGEI